MQTSQIRRNTFKQYITVAHTVFSEFIKASRSQVHKAGILRTLVINHSDKINQTASQRVFQGKKEKEKHVEEMASDIVFRHSRLFLL